MKKFGLIGYPLKHSFSKQYYNDKFEKEGITDCVYELLPLQQISELPGLLKASPELCGLNVTIPHKIGVMFYLDKISPEAKEVDAVNCIKIIKRNPVESFFCGEVGVDKVQLAGFNTDVYGFEESLKPLLPKRPIKALVLGDGGAARAVFYVLKKLHIDFSVVSRRATSKQLSYEQVNPEVIAQHLLIINTTPLGTFPDVEACPQIPYEYLSKDHLLYDLVYNPAETAFLKRGAARGATVKNGMEMLVLQAEKNWEIWNN
ncbi:shikimate dehydrogenase [bacterium A37T11]|nr:shikimate dehydrogenase [bacterium A37T11]